MDPLHEQSERWGGRREEKGYEQSHLYGLWDLRCLLGEMLSLRRRDGKWDRTKEGSQEKESQSLHYFKFREKWVADIVGLGNVRISPQIPRHPCLGNRPTLFFLLNQQPDGVPHVMKQTFLPCHTLGSFHWLHGKGSNLPPIISESIQEAMHHNQGHRFY